MWHGFVAVLFNVFHSTHFHLLKIIDIFVLVFIGLLYSFIHFILFIWLRSAYSIRKAMVRRDEKYFKWNIHRANKRGSIMSQDNIAAEAAQHENGLLFNPNSQPRPSVKNSLMSLYQDETATDGARFAGRSAIRRLSTQVKSFVLNKNKQPVFPRETPMRPTMLAASYIGLASSNATTNNISTENNNNKPTGDKLEEGKK